MYGKIEDNALTIAPEGVTQGYYEVVFTEIPQSVPGGYWESAWAMIDDKIVQTYEWVDMTKPSDVIDDSEALAILLGG